MFLSCRAESKIHERFSNIKRVQLKVMLTQTANFWEEVGEKRMTEYIPLAPAQRRQEN